MKPSYLAIATLLVSVVLVLTPLVSAQGPVSQNQGTTPSVSSVAAGEVPRLIKFSGTLVDAQERPLAGPVGVTFAFYSQQTGGAPLWMETQNVEPDAKGNYTVLLGANSANGVPAKLFASGEARWLGVQVERDVEQPRILLVSVPYALKAGDAETLGGLPPSAFARASNSVAESSNAASSGSLLLPVPAPAATASFNASTDPNVTTLGGTVNFVPKFDTVSDVKTSQIFDNGTDVGIGFPVTPTPAPVAKLDINGSANIRGTLQLPATGTANSTTKGFNSQPFDYLASVFNGTAAVNQHFRWQAEPVNPGLSTASGKLNLLFASSTGTPGETGLSISSKGLITFATGQTFPTVAGNETVTGNLTAKQLVSNVASGTPPLQVTSSTQVPNLNASLLGGFNANAFARLAISNEFLANQIVRGDPGSGQSAGKINEFVGNVGCGGGETGQGSAGIDFTGVEDCSHYSLLGDGANTFLNRPTGGQLHFREGNTDQIVISPRSAGGGVSITAPGVVGTNTSALTVSNADSNGDSTVGVNGTAASPSGVGVKGTSGSSSGLGSLESTAGVWGDAGATGSRGVLATADDGTALVALNSSSVFSTIVASNSSKTAGALMFNATGANTNDFCQIDVYGNLTCSGTITSNAAKPFKIDDPADPADKYLVHVAVESSEMINIYTGNAVLDASGEATVQLPSWFQAENADFRYLLTPVGAPGPNLYVAEEVSNNQFKIAGGKPGQKVSWQITAARQDAWAKANPLEAEQEKPATERGLYVHPELFGQPREKSVYWRNRPQIPKRSETMREKQPQP